MSNTSYEKLEIPIKLSFPVIGVNTFEMSRAGIVLEEEPKKVGKTFVTMQFKALRNLITFENLLSDAQNEAQKGDSECQSLVLFDPFFSTARM